MKMRYFSCVEGRAVPRFGTDTYIGCHRVAGKGFVFDPSKVVAIPEEEVNRRLKDYRNALRRGDIVERGAPVQSAPEDVEPALVDDTVTSAEAGKSRKPKKEGTR
jgi:hypothetical protein